MSKTERSAGGHFLYRSLVLGILSSLLLAGCTYGGSRMVEPPTRSSLWRYGHGTPINSYDYDVNCGGYVVHQVMNEGQCGVCGDPWSQPSPRDNEGGGKYAPNPRPVRAYKKGSFINVAVDSTSDLFGKYEFRLCRLNSSLDTPDQTCFDRQRLGIAEAEYGQSYQIGQSGGLISLNIKLPDSLTCSHCILQWRHTTGYRTNRMECVTCGTEGPKCTFCKGCGAQEWYQGCADIAIYDTVGTHPALMGVRTQEELQAMWEAMFTARNNCSCPTSGQSAPASPPASDNAINLTHPSTESTTSVSLYSSSSQFVSLSPHVTNTVVPSPNTPSSSSTTHSVGGLSDSTVGSSSSGNTISAGGGAGGGGGGGGDRTNLDNYSSSSTVVSVTTLDSNSNQHSVTVSGYPPETTLLHPRPSYSMTKPNTVPTMPLGSETAVAQASTNKMLITQSPSQHLDAQTPDYRSPMVNQRWFDNSQSGQDSQQEDSFLLFPPFTQTQVVDVRPWEPQQPPSARNCYIPFSAPSYLYNARGWCARNCPQRGAVCHYRTCRPTSCNSDKESHGARHQQNDRTNTHSLSEMPWLLPYILMEGFEMR